jgi:exodeoxyribonuclease-5
VVFELKEKKDVPGGGFIVDEASMVGRSLYRDLLAYDRPVIFVGDHGQLPPVGEDDFNLMAAPDVTLKTIHRNAGEIARFAEFLRTGGSASDWNGIGDQVRLLTLADVKDLAYDQVICGLNRSRVYLNRRARRVRGYPESHPVSGDRIMCLQNDAGSGLFNGMQGTVVSIDMDDLVFESDQGTRYRTRCIPTAFNQGIGSPGRNGKGRLPFDYCYAVTCHKAQGDEWDTVVVLEQRCQGWDHRRWAYTAASRARRRLYWILDRR